MKIGGQTFDIEFSVGAAISLNFDCFPMLTRVSEICFLILLFNFFADFFNTAICVEKYIGLSGIFFYVSRLSANLCGRTFYLGFSMGAAISPTFDCFLILTRASEVLF